MSPEERFLADAEAAIQGSGGAGRRSELSFLQRLIAGLGAKVPDAQLSPTRLFRAALRDDSWMRDLREVLEVLAKPMHRPAHLLRAGDLLIRAAPGTGEPGHVSVIASPGVLTQSRLASQGISAESTRAGYYGVVIEAGVFPHRRSQPFARRLLDGRGRVPPNALLLRPRFPAAELPPELSPDEAQAECACKAGAVPGPANEAWLSETESSAGEIVEQPDFIEADESAEGREGVEVIEAIEAGEWVDEEIFDYVEQAGEDTPPPVAPPVAVSKVATIGFEFDLNFGINRDVFNARAADMPAGAGFPSELDKVTDHIETDAMGRLADGFDVKPDASRLEIATLPIKVDDDKTFDTVVQNVLAFAAELEAERGKMKPDTSLAVAGIAGHPVRFTHPRTRIAGIPLVVVARGPRGKRRWFADKSVWAAPQATVAILLEQVGDLIDAIAKTAGDGFGKALTGTRTQRLGVRSDIVVIAKRRVLADRKAKIGKKLSDNSTITATDYSPRLAGLLMLMTSYMLSGEILDPNDYELFAKSYLPINVKTPFRDLYREALSDRERRVFKELYVDDKANFFALARDKATADDKDRELFPPKVRGPDLDRFHNRRLTWGELLERTINDTPLKVTKANSVPKKKHALGDEVLWAPLSTIIPFSDTKPRVALELRRIGFDWHSVRHWEPLMKTVRKLVQSL